MGVNRGVLHIHNTDADLKAIKAKEAEQDAAIAANVDNTATGKRVIESGKIYEVLENGDKVYVRDVFTDINGKQIQGE